MVFSVSKDDIERSLDFEPDSFTLTVKDLLQEMTISSQKILDLVVVSKTRIFEQSASMSSNYLNREGTMEMRNEVLSSVGAQDMDTSRYQMSDLDDAELKISWGNDQLTVDAVFRSGIDTPFSLSTFNDFEMGSMTENAILIGGQGELSSNNSSLLETTPTS